MTDKISREEVLATPSDLEVCECGDYRFQHVGGVGRCRMGDGLTHGFKPCLRFRATLTTEQEKG